MAFEDLFETFETHFGGLLGRMLARDDDWLHEFVRCRHGSGLQGNTCGRHATTMVQLG